MSLNELFAIYHWPIIASMFMAAALALIGAHWTARGKSSQIFVLGQGASLGIVLGLALNVLVERDLHSLNLAFGLVLGAATLFLSDRFLSRRVDRTFAYLSLFIFFLSLTHLITSMVPSLESHMASAYFGDIAVISNGESFLSLGVAGIAIYLIWKNWIAISIQSFRTINQSLTFRSWKDYAFEVGSLVVTTVAVQNMGYLFTTGSLFIATTFAGSGNAGATRYKRRLVLIGCLGSLIGFLSSLISTEIPTAPAMVIGQILIGLILYVKK